MQSSFFALNRRNQTQHDPKRNDPTKAVFLLSCYKMKRPKEGRTQGQTDTAKDRDKNGPSFLADRHGTPAKVYNNMKQAPQSPKRNQTQPNPHPTREKATQAKTEAKKGQKLHPSKNAHAPRPKMPTGRQAAGMQAHGMPEGGKKGKQTPPPLPRRRKGS